MTDGMGEPGIGAAQLLRNVRMQLGEAANVRLVDDGAVPRRLRRSVVAPVERGIDDHALRHPGGAVGRIEGEVGLLVVRRVAGDRLLPVDLAPHRLGVGIDEELAGVAAVSLGRVVGAVDAQTVERSRPKVADVAVPDVLRDLGQMAAVDLAAGIGGVVEADLDPRRHP